MDFEFGEAQLALRDLAREILEKEATFERVKALDAGGEGFCPELWSKLAEANLLGLAVPEELGGMGFGLLEVCLLLQEIGRAAAPVPALASLLLGGLPVAELGSEAQQKQWLAPLAAGDAILSAALVDAGCDDPARPATEARPTGDHWLLRGRKRFVPAAQRAARILVPARLSEGVALFLVDPHADGVTLTPQAISTGEPVCEMELADVPVGAADRLGGDASAAAAIRIHDCATVGVCALQLGVSERALEITTGYLRERRQFGAPLGSFPAVQQRCADAYIDLEALRWVTWRAAWKLSEGQPATREALVAKFWAADAGSRIANSTQHLHGGIGVDVDYPIHRYFLWAKSLELNLGAATPQLVRLGRDMARTGPQELA